MVKDAIAPGALRPGLRIYAIGDVHGCADRLAALHAEIARDARDDPAEAVVLVHLGDYVDRGADSAGVLDQLLAPAPVPGAAMVTLLGNHEAMMLAACDRWAPPDAMTYWLENGGAATLASYGTSAEDPEFRAAIPLAHLELLHRCPRLWAVGDYLFVHAGIRPEVPLDRQDPFDLIWIREPFLSFDGDLPQIVVHGHTPAPAPVIRSHRIGIDTGACFGGMLTCLVLEGQRLRFLVG